MSQSSVLEVLRDRLGADAVLTSPADMQAHLVDWRGRYRGEAQAVLLPRNTEQVAIVVSLCAEAGIPIVPQGGNTGLVGGGTPDASGSAVVLSTSRLKRIRGLDRENGTLTAEAGCTLAAVREAADAAGFLFPLSLAAEGSCTIGGNLATNAGGVQVLRYGNARALCLGLEVVLADGTVWDGLRGLRKDNSGLDLKQVFIGSEGTLGVITAAVLRLVPKPRARVSAWLACQSVMDAVSVMRRLQDRFPDRVDSFELISRATLELTLKEIDSTVDPLPGTDSSWSVLVELTDGGGEPDLVQAFESAIAVEIERGTVVDAAVARSEAQRDALWRLREGAPEAERIAGFSIKHDIALPVSAIAGFLDRMGPMLAARWPGSRLICFGHLGDGNLHYNLSHPDSGFLEQQEQVNAVVFDTVVALGGSIAAEHGVGQLRRMQLPKYRSAVELQMMRAIKQALDPQDLMNPGRVYPPADGS